MNVVSVLRSAGARVATGTEHIGVQAMVEKFSRDTVSVLHRLAQRDTVPYWVRSADRNPVLDRVKNAIYVFPLSAALTHGARVSLMDPAARSSLFQEWLGWRPSGKLDWAAFDVFWNTDVVLCDSGVVVSELAGVQETDAALHFMARSSHEHSLVCVPYYTEKVQYGAGLTPVTPRNRYNLQAAFIHEMRHALDYHRHVPAVLKRVANDDSDYVTRPLEVSSFAGEAAHACRVHVERLLHDYSVVATHGNRSDRRACKAKLDDALGAFAFRSLFLANLRTELFEKAFAVDAQGAALAARHEINMVIDATRNSLKALCVAEIRRV